MVNDDNSGEQRKNRITNILKMGLIIGTFFLLTYGYASLYLQTKIAKPEFCGTCHNMQPYINSWQATTHSQVSCSSCHPQINLLNYIYKYRLENSNPVMNKVFVSDQTCQQCHNPNRLVTPPGNLKIPHNYHSDKSIDCVDCHNNVSHANTYEKMASRTGLDGQTIWKQVKRDLDFGNRVPMQRCLDCHNGTMATRECTACHDKEEVKV